MAASRLTPARRLVAITATELIPAGIAATVGVVPARRTVPVAGASSRLIPTWRGIVPLGASTARRETTPSGITHRVVDFGIQNYTGKPLPVNNFSLDSNCFNNLRFILNGISTQIGMKCLKSLLTQI